MNDEQGLYARIDAYLKGTLDEQERKDFETALASNAELQEQVQDSRMAHAALTKMKLWQMKNLTETIDKEQKQLRTTKRTLFLIAVLSLLVAGLAYVIVFQKDIEIAKTKPSDTRPVATTNKVVSESLPAPLVSKQRHQTKRVSVKAQKRVLVPPLAAEKDASVYVEPEKHENTAVLEDGPATGAHKTTEPLKAAETSVRQRSCEQTHIEAFVAVENACLSDHNGRIHVSNFKGGLKPYEFEVLDALKQAVSTNHLSGGSYTVVIRDQNNCTKILSDIVVKEVDCRKDFELNLSNGDVLELEIITKSATFTVYDKGGNKFFSKEFASGEKIQWNGISSQGEIKAGYFQFQISYQDGTTRMGSVTVVR